MINAKLGPYRVIEQVGEGGMGAVYRAVDEMLGRDVAIKVLQPALAHDEALVERFRREAQSLARISHPNVAALYGLFREQDTLFMAMEFVSGEVADGMIRRRGRLPWAEAGAFMIDVLNGLDGAHRLGIIHRDLKPANLLVASSGTVKISDFGIARVLGTARYTKTGAVVGTLAYMAPEQVRGEEGDARSDVYAAGMVLYELLTGATAFHRTSDYEMMRAIVEQPAAPPREGLSDVPDWLDAVVMKALAKDATDRFQSAAEMLDALQSKLPAAPVVPGATRIAPAGAFVPMTRLAVAPVPPTMVAKLQTPPTPAPGQRRWIPVASSVVVVLSMTAAWAVWRPRPEPVTPKQEARVQAPEDRATTSTAAPVNPPGIPVEPPVERPVAPPRSIDRRPPARVPAATPPSEPPSSPVAPPVVPPVATPVAPPVTPPPAPRSPEPAPRADLTFDNVKILRTVGSKTQEIDVFLTFAHNQLTMTMKKGGGAPQTVPYGSVASAVYSQSKHPRWKEGSGAVVAFGPLAAPVFLLKGTKHWLTLEGDGSSIVLRLDKKNYQAILPELESRTGRRVERDKGQE